METIQESDKADNKLTKETGIHEHTQRGSVERRLNQMVHILPFRGLVLKESWTKAMNRKSCYFRTWSLQTGGFADK